MPAHLPHPRSPGLRHSPHPRRAARPHRPLCPRGPLRLRGLLSLFALSLVLGTALRAASPILTLIAPGKTLTFTAAEFAALPRTELTLPAHGDQPERRFAGVAMRALLTRADAPLGDKLRGPGLLTGVIVRCKDNYAVLFALAEFDENFSQRTILLADQEDGEILPPSAAPLRLVAPGDKRGARSCRQVTSLELITLAKPPTP